MTVSAAIAFTQGSSSSSPGVALLGSTGTAVTASNGNNSGVSTWTWVVISSPPGSAVTPGTSGTSATFNFTPDLPGGYLIQLSVTGVGGGATDQRVFGVNQASGRFIPPFDSNASSLNFSGSTTGWDPIMRAWLLYLDGLATGTPTVVQATSSEALPAAQTLVVEFDANAGAMVLTANATTVDGNVIKGIDVSGSTSGTNTVEFTDANGYQFQDPDQPATFVSTYTLSAPRNVSWTRGTCTRTGVTRWFSS